MFWLTRVARDRDARLRTAALGLAGALLAPPPTAAACRRLLAEGWPDVGSQALRCAVGSAAALPGGGSSFPAASGMGATEEGRTGYPADAGSSEPPALRAAALRLVGCVMALPATDGVVSAGENRKMGRKAASPV